MSADASRLFITDRALFFIFVFSKTFIQAVLVYSNLLLLYPVFFKQKKYFYYTILVVACTIIVGYGNMRLELMASKQKEFSSDLTHFLFFLSQLGMAGRYVLISFLLQITVDFYTQKEILRKIEIEKTNAELNFLKAQVNPHFLFNTLNNLYALILEKSAKSGECVLRLADMMKYLLVEGKENKVALHKEMEMLSNYIELERLRKPGADIQLNLSGELKGYSITPLLILPLIENAFKYGPNAVVKNGFVHVNITSGEGITNITIENNLPAPLIKNNNGEQHLITPSLGLGLENVKKRLALLYSGKHQFHAEKRDTSFFVNIKLQQ